MAGNCSICNQKKANYKCPKCLIGYCSLVCYKDPSHSHEPKELAAKGEPTAVESEIQETAKQETEHTESPKDDKAISSPKEKLFERIAQDPQIKSMLSCKSLQVHLAVIVKLLEDSLLTNEPMSENRREIANMRLCELRMGGASQNVLVEEFVQRILHVYNENDREDYN